MRDAVEGAAISPSQPWGVTGETRPAAGEAHPVVDDSVGVLFRVLNYTSLIPDRYAASLGQISGTGLVAPTFPS